MLQILLLYERMICNFISNQIKSFQMKQNKIILFFMLQQNLLLESTDHLHNNPHSKSPIQTPQCLDLQHQINQINSSFSQQKQHTKKITEDQGFSFEQEQQHQLVIVDKQQSLNCTVSKNSKKFIPYRIKQPKISKFLLKQELTFIAKQSKQKEPLSATLKKQYHNKSLQMKKTSQSKPLILNPQNLVNLCIIKLKRNFIGDNLVYQHYCSQENKKIKADIVQNSNKIIYEVSKQSSTYAYLSLIRQKSNKKSNKVGTQKKIDNKNKMEIFSQRDKKLSTAFGFGVGNTKINDDFFLDSQMNQLLKTKHKNSFIYHKKKQQNLNQYKNQEILFDSEFESGNLQIVSKVNHRQETQVDFLQYDIYLRNDTNTKGHQNWFYFSMKNTTLEKKKVKINIVNLKRNLNLVKQGQKVYTRTIGPFMTEWKISGQNVQIKQNKNINNIYRSKTRMLSFQLDVQPQTQYQVSLLPPFTYSQLLRDLQNLKDCTHARVDTLTYSLIGMAIPVVTFTNFQAQDCNKQAILISARIHPGQTVASFIIRGFMQALKNINLTLPQNQDFLNSTIIKIIPMINPDGVVFGNFRTNYLGYDLNRSFHTDDQITNPQIMALKQLGKKLKKQHGDKFNTFIDLHGHSSQKNIFTYGPDFENGNQKFYKARLLPKILNSKSPYFKYSSCSFKLQEYKLNTARAFFLNNLNVTAFTIESSYAIYESQNGKNQLLTPKQWMHFGSNLLQSLELIHRLNKTYSIKNRTQLKRAVSLTQEEHLKLLNTLKKQMKKEEKQRKIKKTHQQISKGQQDSDGEDQIQDLDPLERDQIEKKLVENTAKNYVLPKVFKPSILYPTVTPKIFNLGEGDISNYKVLYTRRNRYHSIKIPNSNYLHSLQGMQSFKPKARNIRVEKKIQFV